MNSQVAKPEMHLIKRGAANICIYIISDRHAEKIKNTTTGGGREKMLYRMFIYMIQSDNNSYI